MLLKILNDIWNYKNYVYYLDGIRGLYRPQILLVLTLYKLPGAEGRIWMNFEAMMQMAGMD